MSKHVRLVPVLVAAVPRAQAPRVDELLRAAAAERRRLLEERSNQPFDTSRSTSAAAWHSWSGVSSR